MCPDHTWSIHVDPLSKQVEDAQEEDGDEVLVCAGSCFDASAANSWSTEQSGFFVYVCPHVCVCVFVCRRVPRVAASCRSAGHVAPM